MGENNVLWSEFHMHTQVNVDIIGGDVWVCACLCGEHVIVRKGHLHAYKTTGVFRKDQTKVMKTEENKTRHRDTVFRCKNKL